MTSNAETKLLEFVSSDKLVSILYQFGFNATDRLLLVLVLSVLKNTTLSLKKRPNFETV